MEIKVKDTLVLAAELLGLGEGVATFLNGGASEEGERDSKLLLTCFHTVENELALDYFPLKATEALTATNGYLEYDRFSRPAVRILGVEDGKGNAVAYEVFPSYIKVRSGRVHVTYTYAPTEKTVNGVSEYETLLSKRLLAYGIAAEYSLAVGELNAAGVWDKKYKDALQIAYRAAPRKRLQSRRWA